MDDRDFELELHRLQADFDADRKAREEANRKEASYIKATGWSTSLIVALFFGIQIYNSVSTSSILHNVEERTEDLVRDTEERIERIISGSTPDSASVRPTYASADNTLTGVMTLGQAGGAYRLEIQISAHAVIHGASSGRLIGFQYRYSRPLAEVLSRTADTPEMRAHAVLERTNAQFNTLGSDGVLLAPEVGYQFSFGVMALEFDCSRLKRLMDDLAAADKRYDVFVRPILENVATPTREERFSMRFVDNSYITCPVPG
ncbi:hypothetical protein RGUI_1263 [Rhodovulum sp. P5]|uniref:hypothetical protein n=1 Tax=Rhodovulum sp. P5 TaxID=1564506 RepID=UPI0009C3C11B|nr:hypothetical protein [Rhodovulum sp. P5]ARE39404.1 hypothetical protein RGUI_1263 [Rhodovulum sp. P5]